MQRIRSFLSQGRQQLLENVRMSSPRDGDNTQASDAPERQEHKGTLLEN